MRLEIQAYGQVFHLKLSRSDQFFSDKFYDSSINYYEGHTFTGTDKVGQAFGEFRFGNLSNESYCLLSCNSEDKEIFNSLPYQSRLIQSKPQNQTVDVFWTKAFFLSIQLQIWALALILAIL